MNQFNFIIHYAIIQCTTGPLHWMKYVTFVLLSGYYSYSVRLHLHDVTGKQDNCYAL